MRLLSCVILGTVDAGRAATLQTAAASSATTKTWILDLLGGDRGQPSVVGIVIAGGEFTAAVTGGADNVASTAMVDVSGGDLSAIFANGTFWIDTTTIRFIKIAATVASGTFGWALIA